MTAPLLDPATALVVIDLQRGIVGAPTVPNPIEDVIARNVELTTAFRARRLPVVLVRVSFAADGGDVPPGRTAGPSRGGALPADFDVLIDELDVQPTDIIVTKRNWGAFYGTDLDLQLRRRGVTGIVLTGVATTYGVESTARSAHEHGYHVVVATDAIADRTAEGHEHAVTRIFPALGRTATTSEILAGLPATVDA
ncbi:isochorismatase family protein [Nocardia sp. alder85J]|uniref:isochorismatase family protein n=1 Tax=Nocardia sp. alder85J TaxID=2862949 RepID=UPI001CD75C05|nr:isochorismatase family protein [Nocardia sp. alder85J]MCX4092608.1 isochorismatase family protein [Nocardia sp. alder85J]